MKITISIPTSLFIEAEDLAQRLQISRSQLYTKAVLAYVKKHRGEHVTITLNEIFNEEDSSLDPVLAQMQAMSLLQDDDWS